MTTADRPVPEPDDAVRHSRGYYVPPSHSTPDAAAVADVCPYEADAIEAVAWQAAGFYPDPIPDPPF